MVRNCKIRTCYTPTIRGVNRPRGIARNGLIITIHAGHCGQSEFFEMIYLFSLVKTYKKLYPGSPS